MSTYLLTWKSDEWAYENLKERIDRFSKGEVCQQWSCGTSRSISIGSRVLLMMQGTGNGGIFGSGRVVKAPFEGEHYKDEKRLAGKTAWYVIVEFDRLYDPYDNVKIFTHEIKKLDGKIWKSQGSGKKIKDEVAVELEKLWGERAGFTEVQFADEIDPKGLFEGAKKTITVNAYERNPEAREKCLAHYKHNCVVCGFHFLRTYGELGRGYIHVHHLKQLSEVGEEYEVDPIKDLRPVCPNCHSMLHRKRPALSIEELKEIFENYKPK